jgi:hypothetical protein
MFIVGHLYRAYGSAFAVELVIRKETTSKFARTDEEGSAGRKQSSISTAQAQS